MNKLAKNTMLAQRLLGIGHALKSAGQDSAAVYPTLISSLHRIHLSTEAGGDCTSATEPEAPKKRRGRPPKAKPETESAPTTSSSDTTEATPISTSSSSKNETPATASPTKKEQETLPAAQKIRPPRPPKAKPLPQGLSTIINPVAPRDPGNWHSGASVTDLSSSNSAFTPPPFGFYIDIPATALPEGEAVFYHDPLLTEDRIKQPHYGCKAATAEFGFSGKRAVMHRPVIADVLAKALLGSTKNTTTDDDNKNKNNKIYVDGWTGAGKSMALYTLAATARAAGKVVMYIPTATLLTQGGRFYRRQEGNEEDEEEEEDSSNSNSTPTVWDTPEAARHILTAIMNAHADQLATMPYSSTQPNKHPSQNAKTLADIATAGLASTAPSEIVEAAIAVKNGILANVNGMVIVDEYNALYSHTGYHEPMHQFYRRPLQVHELQLAKSFRILEEEGEEGEGDIQGVAVVAPSYGGSISPVLRVLQPRHSGPPRYTSGISAISNETKMKRRVDVVRVPRYNLDEVSSFAAMSVATGGLTVMPDQIELRRALALTNGNGKELREMQSTLLLSEGPLGPSLGYKALAMAKKNYNLALEI